MERFFIRLLIGLALLLPALIACNDNENTPTQTNPTLILPAQQNNSPTSENAGLPVQTGNPPTFTLPPPPTAIPDTPTPLPPTATPEPPSVARVNNQLILQETFQREIARYVQGQATLGITASPDDPDIQQQVLSQLIDQTLIAQAGAQMGIVISPEQLAQQIETLKVEAGGEANFQAWLTANQYNEAEFVEGVAQELLTIELHETITADVPFAVEQAHARYIQVDDPALAQTILEQARTGTDFAQLAQQYSLDQHTGENGGDLDFFPRNWLFVPEIEQAAFTLNAGETSDVIAVTKADDSSTTYYIVQLIEIDPQRRLSDQQRNNLLAQTFQEWLENLRQNAQIELISP